MTDFDDSLFWEEFNSPKFHLYYNDDLFASNFSLNCRLRETEYLADCIQYPERPRRNGNYITLSTERLRGQYQSGRISYSEYTTRLNEIREYHQQMEDIYIYTELPPPPPGYIWIKHSGPEVINSQPQGSADVGWAYYLYDVVYSGGGCSAPQA